MLKRRVLRHGQADSAVLQAQSASRRRSAATSTPTAASSIESPARTAHGICPRPASPCTQPPPRRSEIARSATKSVSAPLDPRFMRIPKPHRQLPLPLETPPASKCQPAMNSTSHPFHTGFSMEAAGWDRKYDRRSELTEESTDQARRDCRPTAHADRRLGSNCGLSEDDKRFL